MINEFFSFEKSWFKKNNIDFYKVLELENQYSYQIDVNGIKVNLLGKIDRIDRVGDQLRIVDYKSGSVTRSELTFQNFEEIFENKAKAKAFQLMMYAYLFSKNTNELGFLAGNFSFKNIKEGLIPLKIKNSKRPLYISQFELDQFEAALKLVIKQIMSEEIEYCQTDNLDICKWCDFKSVCKKD
jgi:CRISPR/Cas system-associated exonuclease Cas4 (RecB family)